MSPSNYFDQFLPAIETEMRRVVAAPDDPTLTTFYGMLHYHLGWVDADFHIRQHAASIETRPTA